MTLAFNSLLAHWQQRRDAQGLPDGYVSCQYLAGDGVNNGQVISTGLKITPDDVVECRARLDPDGVNTAFIGDGNTKTDSNFAIWLSSSNSQAYAAEFSFGDGGSNAYKVVVPKSELDARQWHTYRAEIATGKAYVDGVLAGTASSVSSFANAKNLVIFGSWRGTSANSKFQGGIGDVTIWRNDEKIREYVPAFRPSDQACGMYDLCGSTSPSTSSPLYKSSDLCPGLVPMDAYVALSFDIAIAQDNLSLAMDIYSVAEQYFDWGDGTVETISDWSTLSHTYAEPGTYRIRTPWFTRTHLHEPRIREVYNLQHYNGGGMFEGCTNMTMANAVMPPNAAIDKRCFKDCSSLALTAIPAEARDIQEYAFAGCTSLALDTLPKINYFQPYAFLDCSSITLTSIPPGAYDIPEGLFKGCTSIPSMLLHRNIRYIGKDAFAGCTSLATVKFQGTPWVSLDASIFGGCTSLTDIYVPWSSTDAINANAPWDAPSTVTIHYNQTT